MKKLMMVFGAWCAVLGAGMGFAAEPVEYLDWDGEKLVPATCSDYEVVANGANVFAAGKTYVVAGDVTTSSRITVEGTVESPTRLVLCDGATLTAAQGVEVAVSGAATHALVICGQSEGTGALEATSEDAAGIGGSNGGAGGMVTINGGVVAATGGWGAAGIGGGESGAGGTVTINGGTVTATGGALAAGIGGGSGGAGGTVTINGGVVTAQGGARAAGIGGDSYAAGGTLQFAENVSFAVWAGKIMPGKYSSPEALAEDHNAQYVHIESGKVALVLKGASGYGTVVTNGTGAVVKNTACDPDFRAYVVTTGETVTVSFVLEEGDEWEVEPTSNPMTFENLTEDRVVPAADLPRMRRKPVPYLDWDPVERRMTNAFCSAYEFYEGQTELAAGTWYVVRGDVTVLSRIFVNGATESQTRLILCDGATLTAAQGITVTVNGVTTNALVICGQQGGTGALVAQGDEDWVAGIGGGNHGAGGMVTINGGIVTAIARWGGAGIGGGNGGAGGTVTINGGAVTATSGAYAAGIDGTLRFAEGVPFVVLAGNSAPGSYVPTGTFATDHGAAFAHIEAGKVMLTLEGIRGYEPVVTHGAGVVAENISLDPTVHVYVVTTGETVKVSFVLEEGDEWEVEPTSNPMTFENLTENTVVPAADLPQVRHKPVPYLDWDPVERRMTNAFCSAYEFYEGQTELAAGACYVVWKSLQVADRIVVEGSEASSTRLILSDGVTLSANVGINVTVNGEITNALVICGQEGGTGALIAQGGRNAAGIGGGDGGAGGTVTINGGVVAATGGWGAAGIGGGDDGAGGMVTINGGTVTAQGGSYAAGIGDGNGGTGGMLRFAEGVPFAVWAGDSEPGGYVPTETFATDHGAAFAHIEAGKVALVLEGARGYQTVVTNGAGVVVENSSLDSNARAYVVTTGETVTVTFALLEEGDEWEVEPTSNPMTFENLTENTVVPAADLPRVRRKPVPYVDWDSVEQKMTNAVCTMYEKVTPETTVFDPGTTYVVTGGVVEVASRITVEGTEESPTRIILCDGAKLTAAQGIAVTAAGVTTNALVIYGQQGGTGALVATVGSMREIAGIGGGYGGSGGTVTINGGTVTAQGGNSAAGIGGGDRGSGGNVTINGGCVTATGGECGAGIGGGMWGAGGGVITINGGAVTATGGERGAGIGGGWEGAGGTVVIRNGAVKVIAGWEASVIGHGSNNADDGSVSISGGIFAMTVEDGWLAEHCHVIDNPDPETKGNYPYQVITLFKLTVPQVEHATAQVMTNGTVVAGFAGSVDVLLDSMVRVAFAADPDYRIVANGEKEWIIIDDVTFGTTPGFLLPTIEGIPGTWVDPWQVGEDVVAYTNATGLLTITGTGAMSNFVSAADVPWDPALVTAVTVDAGVTLGKNALAGMSDDVVVTSSIGSMKVAMGGSEPVIPDGMVLVSKTELEAAGAETVEIVGGLAYVGVSVRTNGDLRAETKSWGKVNVQPGDVSVENGSVIIAVPANAEKGFMVLESGETVDYLD